jgi:chemotaxis protein MotD
MIDQSTIGLSAVQTPQAGGKRDKAGNGLDGGKESKNFAALISEYQQKLSNKTDADAEEDAALPTVTGDENADADLPQTALLKGEARNAPSNGFQLLMKNSGENNVLFQDGLLPADAESAAFSLKNALSIEGGVLAQAENGKTEVKTPKIEIKKEHLARKDDQAKVKDDAPVSASEELSMLLGMQPETTEETEPAAEHRAEKPAKHAADNDQAVDAKTTKTEQTGATLASAVATDAAALQQQAASAADHETPLQMKVGDEPKQSEGESETVRLVSADGKGRPVEIELGKELRDDKLDTQSGGKADFVTVLESRRYLGFSSDSNAANLTNAIKSDTSWASVIQNASVDGQKTATEVNTLKLQMNPEHLGNMTASLRLKGEELSVEVRVETVEAYRQLSNDQDGIVKALRDQGFSIDQVTLQLSPTAKTESGQQDSGSQAGNGQNLREGQGENGRQREDNSRRAGGQNNWMNNDQTSSSVIDSGNRSDGAGTSDLYL